MGSWRTIAAGLATLGWIAAGPASAQGLPPLIPNCPTCCLEVSLEDDPERVHVETPLGTITLQLFPSVAPLTVANFLGYIDRGDYTDTIFHRIEPGLAGDPTDDFVIQAGGFAQSGITFGRIETQDPVLNEPCISNVQGTVAMAKVDNAPSSATSQWFVNLNDNTFLDTSNGRFTVFGRVLDDGLDISTAIVNLVDRPPTEPLPPYLTDIEPASWMVLLDSPLLSPLSDPGVHGCFEVAQSGVLLAEDPQSTDDLEPGTVQDLPYALTSTACAGAGTGGSPGFDCNPPGRRVLTVDANTGTLVPDPTAPFDFAEVLLSCEDIAASEVGFTARLADLGSQLDAVLVKTSYTVPEPGSGLAAMASLLTLAALARSSRRRLR